MEINQINVLDHGYIRLVDHMGSDLSVVRAARVSYDAEWRTGEDAGKDERLIYYMMSHKHTSPFEHVSFTFDVKLPMFIGEQWLRHRTMKFNKMSGRYSEFSDEYYVPSPSIITTQSKDSKQMRTDEIHPRANEISQTIGIANAVSFSRYKRLIGIGCPRELARGILPANIYTHMFVTSDLHNLFHFLALRLHSHSQYEIRVYAEAIMKMIESYVPVCMAAFKKALPKLQEELFKY